MGENKCQFRGCDEFAAMHFLHVEDCSVADFSYCITHGTDHVTRHQQTFGDYTTTSLVSTASSKRIECFVHFLFSYPEYESPYGYVELIEKKGRRVFGFTFDVHVSAEIHRVLAKMPMPRPMSHNSMLKAIAVLGGSLRSVELYQLPNEHSTYGGTAHLQRNDEELTVDMRASDAILLALLDDKPIFVPEDLLYSHGD
ncbi:MAG: bifunctional nuclease family protein [Planctomycetota bacterium]|nr:MAG: bifunctional nuclease family protein [Planctomycetota bacterium]